jgi:hypothetical protein
MDEYIYIYIYIYHIYMSIIIRHMQLQASYNLSYINVPNAITCGMRNWSLVANISCKTRIFF